MAGSILTVLLILAAAILALALVLDIVRVSIQYVLDRRHAHDALRFIARHLDEADAEVKRKSGAATGEEIHHVGRLVQGPRMRGGLWALVEIVIALALIAAVLWLAGVP